MARPLRIEYPGAVYHVTFRGNERKAVFRDEADRKRMLDRLALSAEMFGVRICLVCLMPNHVHLLVETPRGNLGAFMQSLLTGYTVYFNRRHHRSGHLFQGRYGAQLVEGDAYLLRLSRYIHLNPVFTKATRLLSTRDRIAHLRSYEWSSYRSYAGLGKPWPFLKRGALVGTLPRATAADYARYVEAGLASTDEEWVAIMKDKRPALGDDLFTARIEKLRHQQMKGRRRDDANLRKIRGTISAKKILAAAASVAGIAEGEFRRQRRGALWRPLGAWALLTHGGLTQRAIAGELGLKTGAAVSHQLRRWREAASGNGKWKRIEQGLNRKLEGM